MKTLILVFASTLVAVANAAQSYWAAIETAEYTEDESDGGNIASYAMYYCTAAKAAELFGGSSLDTIETYVKNHFGDVKSKATTFDSVAFSDGEYHILDYVSTKFVTSAYVALAFYGDDAYRVFGDGSAVLTPYGQLTFNATDAAEGTAGDWQQVPEPTSGLLLLMGLVGLALKRKHSQDKE